MSQKIAAIYAVSENHVIGKDNDIPWRLPADLKHFKRITLGSPVIMGRLTYESIGKPLPGRQNIVISRREDYKLEGADVASSLEAAINIAQKSEFIFLIGGAMLFHEAIDKGMVTCIYETLVHADVDGDVFFELADPEDWNIIEVDAHQADEKNEFAYTFRKLERKKPIK